MSGGGHTHADAPAAQVTDLKCAIPSMVRVLVAWGAVPDTGKESVARSRRCVASRPPGQSALLPGGCWREGAGEPGGQLRHLLPRSLPSLPAQICLNHSR